MRGYFNDSMRMAGFALLLLLLLGGVAIAIQVSNRAGTIAPVQAAPVDTSHQDLLVDASWLAARLDEDTPPVVIDVSNALQYDREHIPGAVHLWWQDTMNLNGAGYGEAFSLSAPSPYRPDIGATQEDTIIVYDDESSMYAARVVWQLRTSGYNHAMVLDGGLAAWKGAGLDTSTVRETPRSVPTPTEIWVAGNEVTTGDLSGMLNRPDVALLDTRSTEQKRDTINDTIRSGQIPGSISLPAASVMGEDGTFRSTDDLTALFAAAGLSSDETVVVYGRFGVESGQVWLALRLVGYDDVRVYDDGWLAWGYDASLPIEPISNDNDAE